MLFTRSLGLLGRTSMIHEVISLVKLLMIMFDLSIFHI